MARPAPILFTVRSNLSVALTPALVAALVSGCADSVVGGDCDPGYALHQGQCVPVQQVQGSTPDGSTTDSGGRGSTDTGVTAGGDGTVPSDAGTSVGPDGAVRVDGAWVEPDAEAMADGSVMAQEDAQGADAAGESDAGELDTGIVVTPFDAGSGTDAEADASGVSDGGPGWTGAEGSVVGTREDGGVAGGGTDGAVGAGTDVATGGGGVDGGMDSGVAGGPTFEVVEDSGAPVAGGGYVPPVDVPVVGAASDAGGVDAGFEDAGGSAVTGGSDAGALQPDAMSCGVRSLCAGYCVDETSDGNNCGACGNVCVGGTACSGGVCVAICPVPLVDCNGSCTDLSSDPDSCGACGAFCASGICNGGVCRTAQVGHLAVIGHDYSVGRTDQNLVVGNAVFLSPHVPVRILSLPTYADPAAELNVDAAIRQVAGTRAWDRWAVADPTALGAQLTVDNFDVFLVYAQSGATDGQIADLARTIAGPMVGFAGAGGVVIVLDSNEGNSGTFPVVNATGVLNIGSLVTVTGDPLDVTGPVDALAIGLPSGYRGERQSVAFQLGSGPVSTTTITLSSTTDTGVVVSNLDGPVVIHTVVVPP